MSAGRASSGLARTGWTWPLLLAAVVAGCGGDGGGRKDEDAARGLADRLGLAAAGGEAAPATTGLDAPDPALAPAPTRPAPAFAPRADIAAAVRANRQQRAIPPDSALPRPTATTEAQLAAQTRAELDRALRAAAKR